MGPYFCDDSVTLYHGDSLDILQSLPDASVDAVVTDPPYGLANTDPAHVAETITRWVNGERDYLPSGSGFMGKEWDAFVPPVAVWDDCLRVLKPGGHVLAFAGSRTMDLMTLSLRLAGFEIRDSIAWLYGSGFPKSLDVSKAVEKHLTPRDEPDLTLEYRFTEWMRSTGVTSTEINAATDSNMGGHYLTAASQPAVPTFAMLDRLRPLLPAVPEWVERIVEQREREKSEARARQERARFLDTLQAKNDPLRVQSDAAQQWQGWGTALKPAFEPVVVARKPLAGGTVAANVLAHGTGALNIDGCRVATDDGDDARRSRVGGFSDSPIYGRGETSMMTASPVGRWPANVVLDESQAEALDEQSGESASKRSARGAGKGETGTYGVWGMAHDDTRGHDDMGGASRFFYVAKADQSERPRVDGTAHPTVKPLDLMRWLVRLVTPPGGTVLEPFAGSGTTVEACIVEGFRCVAIEREADYLPLIESRIARRRNPVRAIELAGEDMGLFGEVSV